MKLSEELKWRGFWNHTTFTDVEKIDENHLKIYMGTDPSADSLHVGHLAFFMMGRHFLEYGHEIVLLVGGGTGLIGDMRDTEERNLIAIEKIENNAKALEKQVSKLFAGKKFELVNNHDWLKDIHLIPFLRDVGKKFNMAELVGREFFKARINNGGGLSFAEFSYTLLQGYDFLYLNREKGVNFQLGGSDQWGNLLSGVELVRKSEEKEVNAMTCPLVINKSTGRKFGKSEGGAVWLDPNKTSPYKFYQFWLNSDDASAVDYLKLFTMLDREKIDEIAKEHTYSPHLRIAQKTLAQEVTDLIHGKARRESVEKVNSVLFGGTSVKELSDEELNMLANEIPTAKIGDDIISSLVRNELAKGSGEVKRLIAGNAISIDGIKISANTVINEVSLIKKGKNTFVLVK